MTIFVSENKTATAFHHVVLKSWMQTKSRDMHQGNCFKCTRHFPKGKDAS